MKSALLSTASFSNLKTNSRLLFQSNLLNIVQPTALVDYQFRLQGSLANYGTIGGSLITTRSGNGTFIGSDGTLQAAGTNVARFDFDPVSLIRKGLLLEGQATNLLTNSNGFLGTSLGGGSIIATRTTYTGTLPDGTSGTVYRFVFNTTTVSSFISFAFFSPTILQSSVGTGAFSLWIKRVFGAGTIGLYMESSNSAPPTGANAYSRVEVSDSWARQGVVGPLIGTKSGNLILGFGNDARAEGSILPAITVDVCNAQYQTNQIDSYIPTTGATATRFADAASMTGLPTTNVTLIEKPAGCATLSAGTLTLNTGYTIDRIMVLPGTYSADQITTIRGLM
jgi:hypothetical protein